MIIVLPYHTIVWVPSLPTDPTHFHVFWYDYAIMVPSLPSDPIHFHVFWYEYAIHMTNDYGITITYYWVRG